MAAAAAAGANTVFPWDRYLIGFYSSFSTLFFLLLLYYLISFSTFTKEPCCCCNELDSFVSFHCVYQTEPILGRVGGVIKQVWSAIFYFIIGGSKRKERSKRQQQLISGSVLVVAAAAAAADEQQQLVAVAAAEPEAAFSYSLFFSGQYRKEGIF